MNFKDMVGKSNEYMEWLDCAVIAIALTTGEGYDMAHYALEEMGRKHRRKTPRYMSEEAVEALGYKIIKHKPRQPNGSRYTQKTITNWTQEGKKYMVFVKGHVFAVLGKSLEDWSKNNRNRVTEVWEIT